MRESTSAAPGSGIAFDTDNEGDWLYVQGNDETAAGGSPHGQTIELRDRAASGGIRLDTFNALELKSSAQATLHSTAHRCVVLSDYNAGAFDAILLSAPAGSINLSAGTDFNVQSSGAAVQLAGTAAGALLLSGNASADLVSFGDVQLVSDSVIRFQSPSGTTLLEVRSDGTFHILTGKAWVADL